MLALKSDYWRVVTSLFRWVYDFCLSNSRLLVLALLLAKKKCSIFVGSVSTSALNVVLLIKFLNRICNTSVRVWEDGE